MYWSDKMEITVLASGSKGNATLIQNGNTSILIDAGISYLQLQKRLTFHQINIKKIDAVLVTHEHSDHIKGLDVLLRKEKPTVFLTEHTLKSAPIKLQETILLNSFQIIEAYQKFIFNEIEIIPFSVSHDSSDAVGFVLYNEGKKIVYCTDIGYLPDRDFDLLRGANLYIFEANYDVTLLFTSARPFYLKQRIDSVK
jgi:phosphoribosyl 1,2-cyclic phosphodiesterase